MSKRETVMRFKCHKCWKTFTQRGRLSRHLSQVHEEKLETKSPGRPRKSNFSCEHCSYYCSRKAHIKKHIIDTHGISVPTKPSWKIKCIKESCPHTFHTRKKYSDHLVECHPEDLKGTKICSTITFNNMEEFKDWKDMIEQQTMASFVMDFGTVRTPTKTTHYFRCSRSGVFKSRNSGKRSMKLSGTTKIGVLCPAYMKAEEEANKVTVTYNDVHVIHENEVSSKRLSVKEKEYIASQINKNIPYDTILNNIRQESMSSESFKRLHLVQMIDLRNIARDFGVEQEFRKNCSTLLNLYLSEKSSPRTRKFINKQVMALLHKIRGIHRAESSMAAGDQSTPRSESPDVVYFGESDPVEIKHESMEFGE